MRNHNVPPMHRMGVEAARSMMESIARPPGPDMRSVTAVDINGPHGSIPVRVYRPHSASSGAASALVWFHGGGMMMGSLDSFDSLARELADGTGSVVVNVGYRLAPEYRFPIANDEAYAATQWMVRNADQWGVSPLAVGVGGDSAGGGLAAATALRARNESGPQLIQQVLIYPGLERRRDRPSMREFGDSPLLLAEDIDWMKNTYLGDDPIADNEYATPAIARDLTGLPPAIVVSAHGDPLRDGVEEYGRRLQDAQVPTAIIRYPGVAHGFFMQTATIARARAAMADVCALAAARFAMATSGRRL
ncbi:lipase [Rhodococcus sp. 05-340-1]|nr:MULTISPECIES: alpha/beta hydrolase [unclassified Rhodococcus (in: high G+C Gram-positive bacteria)]OZD86744.1 lipase [Rhodococcus sp. 05-339-2]OZC87863.1 lipase [Rhodococcus sp. 06-412-2C]OZC96512.1 lipase [Rhodococcus sp. 06-412-2B]OZD65456.1 lipase [Rhodococcus sp. 05-340-2]OZD74677.1 lipase [Rhodococcus sp. 05-340-1]